MILRTITALFTDLVGSTARFSALTHGQAEELRDGHFAALRACVAAGSGSEVKTLGDAMVAVFGSAGGALACPGAMQRSSERNGLGLRIGISTGDATGDADGDWHGPVVIQASRLCADANRRASARRGEHRRRRTRGGSRSRPTGHARASRPPRSRPGSRAPVGARCPRIRVIVADDSALIRDGLTHLFGTQGLEVVARAPDCQTLLHEVARLRPEVVVCDIRTPPDGDLAGLEAAEAILERHPATTAMLLSTAIERHLRGRR